MKFLDKLNKQWSLIDEADVTNPEATSEADATSPNPNAVVSPEEATIASVAPGGYVDLVKLLAKAVAMNFPAGALDEIFRTEITAENAFPMQTALEAAIKQNEMYSDNPERLDNIHLNKFINSVNTNNFIGKYKHVLAAMKIQDPYIKDGNI
jgi:hypothetical protein